MGTPTVVAMRVVLAAVLLGSLFVQVIMVPLLAADLQELSPERQWLVAPIVVLVVLGIVTVQVTAICVWRLLTMARRGTVFSRGAFRYVDIIIGSIATAAVLVFAFGALLAPGEAVAPGVVLLIGGVGVLIIGVVLIVVVLRALLRQAIDRDARASALEAELDEVI